MFVGIIGNSLNIAVLTTPALYNHACSRYFLALGCNNLFVTSFVALHFLLSIGYQLDITVISPLSCKLATYINHSSVVLSTYFIILASIDRYCASSTSAYLRKFSNVKIARWAILLVMIVIVSFYISTPILIDLKSTDAFGCYIRADTIYKQIYPIVQTVLFAIISPGLMILFGTVIHPNNDGKILPHLV